MKTFFDGVMQVLGAEVSPGRENNEAESYREWNSLRARPIAGQGSVTRSRPALQRKSGRQARFFREFPNLEQR
jgi:hypothetical protein